MRFLLWIQRVFPRPSAFTPMLSGGRPRLSCLFCCLAFSGLLWLPVFLPAASGAEKPSAAEDTPEGRQSHSAEQFPPGAVEFFQTKVRPLLEARCFECHAEDSERLEGGLRLDARPLVLKGGDSGPAIVPGKPGESLLIEAVNYESFEMPPRGRMPDGEIAILRKWVELGLPWADQGLTAEVDEEEFPLEERRESHWAWQPVRDVAPPEVSSPEWPRSDVDRFVMAKLDEQELEPAPDADRRTLIRRATFDLIGLPPTLEEVRQFLNDPDPTPRAFAKVVDRLLESPHFGERWARHWLDLVRYAETLGHEFDYPLHHAYKYRDYVIRALNNDVPFDQFIREQIAGDLLPNPRRHPVDQTNESIIGTGFWLLGELKHAPVDVKGEEASIIDNQIDVFSKAFLGLTVSCARCHDHKFDAITMRDYYALAGFMQSSRRQHAFRDPHRRIEATVERLREVHREADDVLHQSLEEHREDQVEQLTSLLLASREVLYGEPQPVDSEIEQRNNRGNVVFADFEGETFGDWKAEGKAFAQGPVAGTAPRQQKVTGFKGNRLVNSYLGTDDLTGTLTSPEFTISRDRIRFLIGGGHFKGETCVNLLVDGEVVRSATGRNNEKLEPHEWDVSDFLDQQAVLQIVDQRKGGWGHVNADHFVFTSGGPTLDVSRPIEAVARETGLDPGGLTRCVKAVLAEDTSATSHPVWAWKKLAEAGSAGVAARLSERLESDTAAWTEFLKKAEAPEWVSNDGDDADGRDSGDHRDARDNDSPGHLEGWMATGWAFDPTGDSGHSPVSPKTADAAATFSSGRLGKKLRGVLRSPTFTLTKPNLVYRIAGEDVTVRLIIDGYIMDKFNGLLFRGCKFEVNNPRMHWKRQGADVANYVGHRAHIEFIDNGNGWAMLDDVRLIDSGQPAAEPVAPANEQLLQALRTRQVAAKPAQNGAPADEPSGDDSSEGDDSFKGEHSFEAVCCVFAEQIVDSVIERTSDVNLSAGRPETAEARHANARGNTGNVAGSREEPEDLAAWTIAHRLAGEPVAGTDLDELRAEAAKLDQQVPAPAYVLALTEGWSENEHVFIRGSHKNLGDVVPRRMLEAISGDDQKQLTEGSGRLALARRLLAPSNPFPARVKANRIWSHLFGRGIVASVDNFGVLGEEPTHPKLLDHLAREFVNGGWSIKQMIRSLMLTRTYQMDSRINRKYADVDPENQWWHRMPIRRLEGEAIRDAMLAVSGSLDRSLLGPPVPVHLTRFMQGRGRPRGGPLDGDGRRSIYTSVNRNFLPPMMLAFDTPIPFTTIGRRTQSNVPAQALILMNDPFVIQQAERWAKRELAESVRAGVGSSTQARSTASNASASGSIASGSGADSGQPPAVRLDSSSSARVDRLYRRAFSRPATDKEIAEGIDFLQSQADLYGDNVDWKSDVRVWKDLCHVLFNVKEFIFIR